MSELKKLFRTMVDFVFDRHHYIMVTLFILFLIFLIIIVGTNSDLMPYPIF
ncbi:MAG: hypothetical protein WCT23_05985 [Candidatus Neomarinimicrobiota bacterium]